MFPRYHHSDLQGNPLMISIDHRQDLGLPSWESLPGSSPWFMSHMQWRVAWVNDGMSVRLQHRTVTFAGDDIDHGAYIGQWK
jgi:hypothetical protein